MLARAAHINAEMAELARDVCVFDDNQCWVGAGMRSCADWITNRLGFSRHTAESLLLAGQAARELPAVAEAFQSGELSIDKVRVLSPVATPAADALWVERARESSPTQLARRCREERNSKLIDDAERYRVQRAQRSVRMWWDELSMFRLSAVLPAEDGRIVEMAIDEVARRLDTTLPAELHPPDSGLFATQADALVSICSASRSGRSTTDQVPVPPRMAVHVDLGVLTAETPDGRGHIEDGAALSLAALRRLGCDASVKAIVERDGVEIGATRETPRVPAAMRRRVQSRDRTCRAPAAPHRPPTPTLTTSTGGASTTPPECGISSASALPIITGTSTRSSRSSAPRRETSGS